MLIAMSTQLLSGPSPGPYDVHPFIGAAMVQVTRRDIWLSLNMQTLWYYCWFINLCFYVQESSLVSLFIRKLLLNYITRPQFLSNSAPLTIFSEGNQPGVLQRVGSAAGTVINLVIFLCSCFYFASTLWLFCCKMVCETNFFKKSLD